MVKLNNELHQVGVYHIQGERLYKYAVEIMRHNNFNVKAALKVTQDYVNVDLEQFRAEQDTGKEYNWQG